MKTYNLFKGKAFLLCFIFLFVFSLVSAELDVSKDTSINNIKGVNLIIPDDPVNSSAFDVNDTRYWNGNLWSDTRWLNIDGSNANQNLDFSPWNLTVHSLITAADSIYVGDTKISSGDVGLNITGNITAESYSGDGSRLSNLNISGDGDSITLTGNMTAGNFNGGDFYGGTFYGDGVMDYIGTSGNPTMLRIGSSGIGIEENPLGDARFYSTFGAFDIIKAMSSGGTGNFLELIDLALDTIFSVDGFGNLNTTGNITTPTLKSYSNSTGFTNNKLFSIISDTRGTPQFQVQDGGANQASLMVRSWIVVNQNNTLLNSSQNNICSDWGFDFIDCNTSTTGADFGVTDDIEASGLIHTGTGFRALANPGGAYMASGRYGVKYPGTTGGYYNVVNDHFCDLSNPFLDEGGWLMIIEENEREGMLADIDEFINSTCITIKNNPGWNESFSDVNFIVVNSPDLIWVDGGFFEYYVGDNMKSQFKIKAKNATGHSTVLIDTKAGHDDQQSLSILTDIADKSGIAAMGIIMSSSTGADGNVANGLKISADGTGFNNGTFHLIDLDIIGTGNNNYADIIKINGDVDHIIHSGAAADLTKAYYQNSTGIYDVTAGNFPVFNEDESILYIGSTVNFTSIGISISSGASADITAEYYYCNDAEVYQGPVLGVLDSTSGFQQSGSIVAGNPSDRGLCNQAIDGTPFANTTEYTYIAIKRKKNNLNTPPIFNSLALGGGTAEFLLASQYMKLEPIQAEPISCTAVTLGAIYFNTIKDDMCVCKSSGWKEMTAGVAC